VLAIQIDLYNQSTWFHAVELGGATIAEVQSSICFYYGSGRASTNQQTGYNSKAFAN
jgi:hypothetical protein